MTTEETEKLNRTLPVPTSTERKRDREKLIIIRCIPDGMLASDEVYPP